MLTSDGVKFIKQLCLQNLDYKADDKREQEIMTMFMQKAKDEGWLCKQTGKAEKDIKQRFRKNNSYLRAQIRQRVMEDMCNKTAEEASDLPRSEKFIREHIGVAELNNEYLRILYNFAYTHLKYINKKVALSSMTQGEKKIARSARDDQWCYTMERVTSDKANSRDFTVIKTRFAELCLNGPGFEPV